MKISDVPASAWRPKPANIHTMHVAFLVIARCGFGIPIAWTVDEEEDLDEEGTSNAITFVVKTTILRLLVPNWMYSLRLPIKDSAILSTMQCDTIGMMQQNMNAVDATRSGCMPLATMCDAITHCSARFQSFASLRLLGGQTDDLQCAELATSQCAEVAAAEMLRLRASTSIQMENKPSTGVFLKPHRVSLICVEIHWGKGYKPVGNDTTNR
ncbi:hypothetical protein GALMADRAFT_145923 [Galerina marginata CBS 339.88]|uniref:Uncharacterized protein n=1 Tax=Galerina marginata (strain CBS 339.88) TaxID=685588 RepID=A0A067SFY5_GALM3|nr:hypothetical protein GALMADRAFT_145923 [Galerina marginata CBS 339.88]